LENLYIKYNEKIAELDTLEKAFPLEYLQLIAQIDRFIFGANEAYHIATQAQIIAKDIVKGATVIYNMKYFEEIRRLQEIKSPSSTLKELARAHSSDEKKELVDAENLDTIASLLRADCSERLNTYKKIKDGNSNER